jgi:streptogramin lyase
LKWSLAALAAAAVVPFTVSTGGHSFGAVSAAGSVWIAATDAGAVLRVDPESGKVQKRITVAPSPFVLAAAPGAVWVASRAVTSINRIDTKTNAVTTVTVGAGPYAVAWGFGSAWVSNSLDGTVSRVTGTKAVKTIRVGVEPNGLAAIGSSLWVTDHTAGTLIRIDPSTNRITGRVKLPGADWVTAAAGSLWVSEETNVVARVDPHTLKVLARVPVQHNPLGSAVVHGQLWVPCIDSNSVVVVDPVHAKVVRSFAAGPGPIVVLPVGKHVWITHTNGNAAWRL